MTLSQQQCVPLQRAGDRYVPDPIMMAIGIELPTYGSLERYFATHYTEVPAEVELSGAIYATRIYLPKDRTDRPYVVVGDDYVPLYAERTEHIEPGQADVYLDRLRALLERSEAMLPEQESYLPTQFLSPFITEFETRLSVRPEIRPWSHLKSVPRFVIFGEAGAGKTTCLRRFVLEHIASQTPSSPVLPVYLQMRTWSASGGVLDRVRSDLMEFNADWLDDDVEQCLATGQIMLIFDGLDELPASTRDDAIASIKFIANRYRRTRIALSTRLSSYDWQFSDFVHFRLEPWTNSQIRQFSYQKLATVRPWKRFITSLFEEEHVLELARNPLMLSLMVALYSRDWLRPEAKSQAVDAFVHAVVSEWDAVRGVRRPADSWLNPHNKISILCRTAHRLAVQNRNEFLTEEFCGWESGRFAADRASRILWDVARNTDLLRREHSNRWSFVHRGIQDYLVALHLVMSASDSRAIMGSRLHESAWQRVWLFACGVAQDGGDLIRESLGSAVHVLRRATLAMHAVAQSTDIERPVVDQVISECIRRLTHYLRGARVSSRALKPSDTDACEVSLEIPICDGDEDEVDELIELLRSLFRNRSTHARLQIQTQLADAFGEVGFTVAQLMNCDGHIQSSVSRDSEEQITIRIMVAPESPHIPDSIVDAPLSESTPLG